MIVFTDKQIKNFITSLEKHICDVELRTFLEKFIFGIMINKYSLDRSFMARTNAFIKSFINVRSKDISWTSMCRHIKNCSMGRLTEHVIVQFYFYLLQNDVWEDEYKDYLNANSWIFTELKGEWTKERFYYNSSPYNFYRIVEQKEFVDLRSSSDFIRELLKKYVDYECSNSKYNYRMKIFIRYFEKSLYAIEQLPNKIEDFSDRTFKMQYRFYKKISWQDNHKTTRYLKGFYIFLIDCIIKDHDSNKIFSNGCGLDKYYLKNDKFDIFYGNGYKVVYYNKFDCISELNRWALAPNGEEKHTVVKNGTEYIFLDFLRVKDLVFRKALKQWFVFSSKNINTKQKMISCILRFFEFIESEKFNDYVNEDLINIGNWIEKSNRHFSDKKNKGISITVEMIIAYRLYLLNYYDNSPTINNNISSVKDFINYVYEENICSVEYEVFECLKLGDKGIFKGKPLLKEDADLIVNKFKDAIKQGDKLVNLLWIIFNICLTTNLRIGEVIGLQRDCIVETMKKGQHAIKLRDEEVSNDIKPVIKLKRKNSGGKLIEYNPTAYLLRNLEVAKKITEELVEEADSKISNFIFLKISKTGRVTTITEVYFYHKFKELINDLPLIGGPYTVYNLRDTFMTGIYYKAINEGLDLFYTHAATGHKEFSTTVRHYINYDVRHYLEATYMVQIGDVDIKGQIVINLSDAIKELPKNIKNILVKNECGYCNNGNCDVDCLLCNFFIVTLDRIPYFEKAIIDIDTQINNESIQHEKEHLGSVKKLYVGFLERLYILKIEEEGNKK